MRGALRDEGLAWSVVVPPRSGGQEGIAPTGIRHSQQWPTRLGSLITRYGYFVYALTVFQLLLWRRADWTVTHANDRNKAPGGRIARRRDIAQPGGLTCFQRTMGVSRKQST